MLEMRDAQIVLQNLLNRATDVEITNATIEKRAVDLDNIRSLLSEFKKILGTEIEQHRKKLEGRK